MTGRVAGLLPGLLRKLPEIASVFQRCRIPFQQVTGMLENDAVAWGEISDWTAAARVAGVSGSTTVWV